MHAHRENLAKRSKRCRDTQRKAFTSHALQGSLRLLQLICIWSRGQTPSSRLGEQSNEAVPNTGLQPHRKAISQCKPLLHGPDTSTTNLALSLLHCVYSHTHTKKIISGFLFTRIYQESIHHSQSTRYQSYPASRHTHRPGAAGARSWAAPTAPWVPIGAHNVSAQKRRMITAACSGCSHHTDQG